MVSFDYSRKELVVAEPFNPSGDFEKDVPIMKAFFADKVGKYPEDAFTFPINAIAKNTELNQRAHPA